MGRVYENILELIGHTPIVHLHKIEEQEKSVASLYAKLESFNPGGSVKDRAALNMIDEANIYPAIYLKMMKRRQSNELQFWMRE